MDRQKLEQYKQALLAEEGELNRIIEATQGGGLAEPMPDAVSELSSYDNHPADLGSEMFERSKDFSLRENARIQKQKIREALASIEDGTFGICRRCGQEIPEERLEAIPSTTLCLQCKQEGEDLPDRHVRPIEEDVLFPPFSRSFTDGGNENLFDGEDAWQAVAQYGTSESPSDVPEAKEYHATMVNADENKGNTEDVDSIACEDEEDEKGEKDLRMHYSTSHGKKK